MPDGALLTRARELVDQLDFPAAQQLLRDQLTHAPTDPLDAQDADADTAALYAGVLLHLNEPHAARGWASYAYSAADLLHGEHDRRTLHALGVLACALHRVGSLDRATRHYQQLITALTSVEGHDGDRTLAARADAAVVEHARGMCASARSQLTEAVAAHEHRHGRQHPVAIRMNIRLSGMWRDCGNFDRAHHLLAQARANAAALPASDDTHRLLSAASRSAANQQHICGVETMPEAATPPAEARHSGVSPDLPIVVPQPDDLIPGPHPEPPATTSIQWPDDEIFERMPDPWQQPSKPTPPPPPAPAPMARPDVPPLTQHTVASASLWPPIPSAPRRDLRPLPARRNMPWESPRPRSAQRISAMAVLAIGAAIAAAISLVGAVILVSQRDTTTSTALGAPARATPGGPPSGAAPTTSAPLPSGPVNNLKLVDQGDRIRITWSYPDRATAAVILSAAPAGEPMRPLQSLPAGTQTVVLPGLDPKRDYCVTVTLAYRADQMVMASPVCTDRKRVPLHR